MALPAPSYSNPGGAGDRTADITVTTSTGLISQSPSNLVDGQLASNNTDAVSFIAGSATGVFHDVPPLALVEALDAALEGKPA